ncbi:MAG: 1-acyl-sn-glycerol-3-phosphate acyltransferase [Hyphomicrobiales bacterium]|nr:1-acyl-sn-glycerol-3-phosphate acyltransferase [Hyphomicrobiales bacterium]MBV8663723.1 1-acyl-sn-glycerol-3-phosphate acyltransferase [Hyphomicrobiales bacterium]
MIRLRSLVFNLAFYANLIVLMIIGLPVVLFGRHGVFALARLWGTISLWLLETICGLRVEFRGLENIPKGGYILASKHQSFLETFSLLEQAPDFAIVLKKQLVYIPVFGLYLVAARQIAIDRSRGRNAMAQIIAQAGAVLRGGRQTIIFPEGTRRPPGAPPRYKQGVTALYAATDAPCLPVALNTGLFWGRRGFTRRPGVAVIEYLPPIPPGLPREVFADRLERTIEDACARLNAEALGANPSLAPILAAGAATIDEPRVVARPREA